MNKGNSTKAKKRKAKKNLEHVTIEFEDTHESRTFTVRTAPSGNKYIQASFGNKPDGKPLVKKITAPTLKELEAAIRDYIDELNGKGGANLTYLNACLQYIKIRAIKQTTKDSYIDHTRSIFMTLHDKPIKKLTKFDFYNAIDEEAKQKNPAQSTMKQNIKFLCMVCTMFDVPAMTPKLKKDLQEQGARLTQCNEGRKSRNDWNNAPSAVQVAKWAGETDTDDRTAISILLGLHSLRGEETRGLRFKEVFMENGNCYVNIRRTRIKNIEQESTKNKGSERKILIDPRLYNMIRSLPHKSEDEYIIDITYYLFEKCINQVIHSHTVNGHSTAWITPHILRHLYMTENAGNLVAEAVGGWSTGGGKDDNSVAKRKYTHIAEIQARRDELMLEYSKKLLDGFEGISEPSFTVSAGAVGTVEKFG